MKEQIQQCIQNCSLSQSRQSLAQSDCLSDVPVDEVETLYTQYTQHWGSVSH